MFAPTGFRQSTSADRQAGVRRFRRAVHAPLAPSPRALELLSRRNVSPRWLPLGKCTASPFAGQGKTSGNNKNFLPSFAALHTAALHPPPMVGDCWLPDWPPSIMVEVRIAWPRNGDDGSSKNPHAIRWGPLRHRSQRSLAARQSIGARPDCCAPAPGAAPRQTLSQPVAARAPRVRRAAASTGEDRS